MVTKRSKKSSSVSVSFKGVQAGGMSVPDGNYRAYPEEVTQEESDDGNPYLKWKWKIVGPKAKGALVWDNTSLQPQALWRLRGLLETLGHEIDEDDEMDLDLEELAGDGNEITLEITNEKYKGKDQPRITGFSTDGEAGGEEEDDDDKKSSKKSSKKDDDDDDDDDDDKKEKSGKDERVGKKPKFKEGSKVRFEDEKGKTHKGTVTEVDGDTIKVEDSKGEEWEIDADDLELA